MILEIEDLVIEGVSGADSARLVAVLEQELEALAQRSPSLGRFSRNLPGGVFEIPAGSSVDDIARQVARSIWSSSGEGTSGSPRPPASPSLPVAYPPEHQLPDETRKD